MFLSRLSPDVVLLFFLILSVVFIFILLTYHISFLKDNFLLLPFLTGITGVWAKTLS